MQIVIIGSGNVATVLGKKMKQANHQIVQVYSQQLLNAQSLALELGCSAIDALKDIVPDADLYIVSVSDKALPILSAQLHFKGMVVHTAGALPKEVLKDSSANYGILYPLQSLRKEKLDYGDIPLLVDGNTADDLTFLEDFAAGLSSIVHKTTDEERLKLHVAAVFVSNFTNHLYDLGSQFCKQENISFNLLKPLINETAQRLAYYEPHAMQTGPAARNDMQTIEKHQQMLASNPHLANIYRVLTESIQTMNRLK